MSGITVSVEGRRSRRATPGRSIDMAARGDGDDLDAEFAAARADEAVEERRRLRDLTERVREQTTFAELLVGHAVGGAQITAELRGGIRHQGQIVAVGADVVVLQTLSSRMVLMATSAIGSIRHHGAAGAEDPPDLGRASTLHGVLSEWSSDRRRVVINTAAGTVSGRLVSTGPDVVTVETDSVEPEQVQVWLPSVTDVSVPS